mmetsp:Transcript_30599/g.57170  ORF Transcript_30599/g.57170 Transcript_30599/m.57170 type:complete len:96 (-) Transcript_30599:441-728(-)
MSKLFWQPAATALHTQFQFLARKTDEIGGDGHKELLWLLWFLLQTLSSFCRFPREMNIEQRPSCHSRILIGNVLQLLEHISGKAQLLLQMIQLQA